jgi:hypothetical protein
LRRPQLGQAIAKLQQVHRGKQIIRLATRFPPRHARSGAANGYGNLGTRRDAEDMRFATGIRLDRERLLARDVELTDSSLWTAVDTPPLGDSNPCFRRERAKVLGFLRPHLLNPACSQIHKTTLKPATYMQEGLIPATKD